MGLVGREGVGKGACLIPNGGLKGLWGYIQSSTIVDNLGSAIFVPDMSLGRKQPRYIYLSCWSRG